MALTDGASMVCSSGWGPAPPGCRAGLEHPRWLAVNTLFSVCRYPLRDGEPPNTGYTWRDSAFQRKQGTC